VAHGDAREEKWRGKRRMEWVAKQASVWLGTVHPVLLQSFSLDPHCKKASTRLNWQPRRYDWTRPFRWKTESGFCACAITYRFHSTSTLYSSCSCCAASSRRLPPPSNANVGGNVYVFIYSIIRSKVLNGLFDIFFLSVNSDISTQKKWKKVKFKEKNTGKYGFFV